MKRRSLGVLAVLALITGVGLTITVIRDSKLADPLIGGAPVGDEVGWYRSEWFGDYNTTFAPWLLHAEHGFIFLTPESTDVSLFVYDAAMGAWWWTREGTYPSLYLFDPPADKKGTQIASAWVYYDAGSSGPRWFSVLNGPSAGSFLSFDP
jgi:hypothetical protein